MFYFVYPIPNFRHHIPKTTESILTPEIGHNFGSLDTSRYFKVRLLV